MFFLSMVSLLLTCFVQGQEFFGGAMLGINGCQVGGDGLSGYKKFGVSGGGFVGLKFTPESAVRMELEYSQKGSSEIPSINLDEAENWELFSITEHCIDLPVLYQHFFGKRISVEAGLSGTYLISHQSSTWGEVAGSGKEMTLSLNFVAGVYFHINNHLFVNLRTSNGLTPFLKTYDGMARRRLGPFGQYNDLLTLTVGWDFGKGAVNKE